MVKDVGTWNMIYPCYLDNSKTYSQGRRVAMCYSVKAPTIDEIKLACDKLKVESLIEREKSHPKEWPPKGRIRVKLPSASDPQISTKVELLKKVGSLIPLLKTRQDQSTSSKAPGAEAAQGKTKKKKKGKKQ